MKAKDIIRIMQTDPSVEEQGKTFKVGFFLCTAGTASVLIDRVLHQICRHTLVMLYPNAQIHVVQHSDDWEGRIEMDNVENYYPTLDVIDPRDRVVIRNSPCLAISDEAADYLMRLCDLATAKSPLTAHSTAHSPHASHTVIDRLCSYRHSYLRSAILVEVVGLYLTAQQGETHPIGKHEGVVNRFFVLLLQHAHAERTVQYYAEQLYLTPSYLSSIIKEETGKTAMEWITLFTINLCKHYLADTDKSIKEIADVMHFPDQSTFGRYFKRHMGCSPGEYRHSTIL